MSKHTSNKATGRSKRSGRAATGGDIVVRATRRAEPDLRRLARALIELAQQEMAREAEQESASGTPANETIEDEAA